MSSRLNKLYLPHNFLTAISSCLNFYILNFFSTAKNRCDSPLREEFIKWQTLVGSFFDEKYQKTWLKKSPLFVYDLW